MSNQPNAVHAALSADENSIDPLDERPGPSPRHIAGLSLHHLYPQDTANPRSQHKKQNDRRERNWVLCGSAAAGILPLPLALA